MEQSILFKNNILVKSKNSFKVEENRALHVIFLEVQKNKSNIVYIDQNTFKQALKSNNFKRKNGVEQLLLGLVDKHIELKGKNNTKWKVLNGISNVSWNTEKRLFVIEVPTALKKLLTNYKKEAYTQVNLTDYLLLRSYNTQRLYELIRAYSKYGVETVIEYGVKEIRELLNLNNAYELFSSLRVKVIENALREFELNKLFQIKNVEYIKVGKNVVSIKFYVIDLKPKISNIGKVDSDGNTPLNGQVDLEELLENDM